MSFADMDLDLLFSLTALLVSGLTGIIGMWIERDPERSMRVFTALGMLCFLTTAVSMYQAVGEAQEAAKQEEAMANVLQKLDTIMQKSGVEVPAINELVKSELASASRHNPDLVRKVAQRVADSGGNPASVLGSYLPQDEVKRMQRSGSLAIKHPQEVRHAAAAQPEPRKTLQFGSGPAQLRRDDKPASAAIPTAIAAAAAPEQPATAQLAAAQPVDPAAAAALADPPPTAAAPANSATVVTPIAPAGTPTAITPKPATKPRAAVRKATPKSDVDIYEEAEQDIRRTRK